MNVLDPGGHLGIFEPNHTGNLCSFTACLSTGTRIKAIDQ